VGLAGRTPPAQRELLDSSATPVQPCRRRWEENIRGALRGGDLVDPPHRLAASVL